MSEVERNAGLGSHTPYHLACIAKLRIAGVAELKLPAGASARVAAVVVVCRRMALKSSGEPVFVSTGFRMVKNASYIPRVGGRYRSSCWFYAYRVIRTQGRVPLHQSRVRGVTVRPS